MSPSPHWRDLIVRSDLRGLQDLRAQGWDPKVEPVSPLAYASLRAQPQIVQWLLDLGLRPSHDAPISALHAACSGSLSEDRKDVIQALIAAGASLDSLNRSDRTPLMCALVVNDLELAKYLLSCGARWDQSNSKNQQATDFFVAQHGGGVALLEEMLLEHHTAPIAQGRRTRRL